VIEKFLALVTVPDPQPAAVVARSLYVVVVKSSTYTSEPLIVESKFQLVSCIPEDIGISDTEHIIIIKLSIDNFLTKL
jgi:hypothetical protein